MTPDMNINLAGLEMKNPVMTASGTFGYGEEFSQYCNLEKIGAFITKGLSLKPRAGNQTPRIVETPGGMLNAIGLQNVGIDTFITKKVPFLRTVSTPAIANYFGATVDEYVEMTRRLNEIDEVKALEINISCPNVKQGGIVFGTDPNCAASVVSACRKVTDKPLIVKLSPNVTDIVVMARACEDAGADVLSLINTLTGMSIDLNKRRPVLANVTGGFSGPAIKPIALRMVWQVAKVVKVPIIGIGGIMNATDALEFILAGATAVQIGTASFINPGAAEQIANDMAVWLQVNKIDSIKSLVGTLEV